jgi:hypothetical protein
MKIITETAVITCDHSINSVTGRLVNKASQHFVYINESLVQVDNDPGNRPVLACPNSSGVIPPCALTMKVEKGNSQLVYINGKPVCLDTTEGRTVADDITKYRVRDAGQDFVTVEA